MRTNARGASSTTKHKEDTLSVIGWINDTETCIGCTSVENAEKAGRKADSVQSIENRWCYKTVEERHQFMRESFQLDMKAILNADTKLKEAVNCF